MMLLRQSTAVELPVGPFVDAADGVTAESGLTITQPDIRLKKNGGAWAQKNAAQTLAHEENGWYEVALDETDTGTAGHLILAIAEAGALPVWREFMVVPANVYDALVAGTDALQVHAIEMSNDLITAAVIASDAIGAAELSTAAAAKLADAVWDEALSGHTTPGTAGEALANADSSGGLAGAGALQRSIGITVDSSPLEGASVWVSTDANGTNVVAGTLVTNSMGEVTVLLDAGTYYVWMQADGYHPLLGEAIVISA